jgi:hypothetical protein
MTLSAAERAAEFEDELEVEKPRKRQREVELVSDDEDLVALGCK